MRLLHISDNHGYFESIDDYEFDVIVASGDFFRNYSNTPNYNKQSIREEYEKQTNWFNKNSDAVKSWAKNKPIIFCSGNHDYFNGNNEWFINCTNKLIEFNGYRIYGFPYVPYHVGRWNFETKPQEAFEKASRAFKQHGMVDVVVTHCPPHGTLDYHRDHGYYGSAAVAYLIGLMQPAIVLCGHVHSGYGTIEKQGIRYSNAAIGDNPLELKPRLFNLEREDSSVRTTLIV